MRKLKRCRVKSIIKSINQYHKNVKIPSPVGHSVYTNTGRKVFLRVQEYVFIYVRLFLRKSPTKGFDFTRRFGSSLLPSSVVSELPQCVVKSKPLVGDFRKKTLRDATQPDKLLQQVFIYLQGRIMYSSLHYKA